MTMFNIIELIILEHRRNTIKHNKLFSTLHISYFDNYYILLLL